MILLNVQYDIYVYLNIAKNISKIFFKAIHTLKRDTDFFNLHCSYKI